MSWPAHPRDDAPPAEWARFYRSLGWLPLPVRCEEDLESYATWLAKEAIREVEETGRRLTAEDKDRLRAEAREDAFSPRSARAPMVPWRKRWEPVTDTEIDAWWGKGAGKRGPKRGIWVAMGRLTYGAPAGAVAPMAVDVDPRSGGEAEPWMGNGGPIARTPRGGVHALHVWDPSVPCEVSPRGPAIGVDVRSEGGGIVVPSGLSSRGRTWERWEPLSLPPAALLSWAAARGTAGTRGATGQTAPAPAGAGVGASAGTRAATGGIAEVLSTAAPDGSRNATAAQIVGMLARPKAIPEDALEPALAMLAEAGGFDLDEWRRVLTRGPRNEEHAVAFLLAWNDRRADPSWTVGRCTRTARNLWRTAQRRDPNVGAEDLHHGEEWGGGFALPGGVVEAEAEAGTGVEMTAAATVEPLAILPALPPEQVIVRKTADPLAIPDLFCIDLQVAYTPDDMEADLAVTPISLGQLPPWRHFDDSEDREAAFGYGLGPWLDASLAGGLTRGSFISIGALTAKAGKTTWMQQAIDGLTIESAMRLRAEVARRDGRPLATGDLDDGGPVILSFWLTEMEKHKDISRRMVGRYLEIDTSFWSRGTSAHLAPGIQQVSMRYGIPDPRAAAMAASMRTRRWLDTPMTPLALARALTVNLDPATIPRPKNRGRMTRDPRRGVGLLDLTARAIERRCDLFAEHWQIERSRLLPIVVLDPVQRWIDAAGEDRLTALNEIIHEARELAHGRQWIVMATSDTTKAGAGSDKDMTGDPAALAASAFAGSQNLAHEPDTVIVLHAEQVDPPTSGPRIVEVPVQVRVCLCRRAAAGPPLPYRWLPHYGRYYAIDPANAPKKGEVSPHHAIPSGPPMVRRGRPKKHGGTT